MTSHHYRLYRLDGAGRIRFADWIEAASDELAVAHARQAEHGAQTVEIWQQNRLVATLGRQDLSAA